MAVLLGLLVALSYGAGDFFGGLSSRRLTPLVVVRLSQLVGLLSLVVLVLVLPGHAETGDLVRGGIAGTTGLVGLVLLYRGLASGAMSIVAPVTAVGAAVLPVAWGVLQGERPGVVAIVGVFLALGAVALVARPPVDGPPVPGRLREAGLALVAGSAFGVVFILFAATGDDSGLWPVLSARAVSFTVISLVLTARRERFHVPREISTVALLVGTGLLDAGANGLFVIASREGLLSVVAVLSSLYPAATLVLARIFLHEQVSRPQQIGLAGALVGVVLISV